MLFAKQTHYFWVAHLFWGDLLGGVAGRRRGTGRLGSTTDSYIYSVLQEVSRTLCQALFAYLMLSYTGVL